MGKRYKSPKDGTYNSWRAMIKRCRYKSDRCFNIYGARGIGISKRWLNYDHFYNDMGKRPDGMSIERIDANKGYNKKNCRWATIKEQNNNKRTNIKININGETKTAAQWIKHYNINKATFWYRVYNGWNYIKALTHKPIKNKTYELNGKEYKLCELSKKFGINRVTIARRLKLGWSLEKACTEKVRV